MTGASAGIGAATARELAGRGFHVLAGVRRAADAEALRATGIEPVTLDVTDEAQIAALASRVAEDAGRRPLRALVNNAGIRAAALAMGGDRHDLGGSLSEDAAEPVALQPFARIELPEERAWAAEWIAATLAREKVAVTPEVNPSHQAQPCHSPHVQLTEPNGPHHQGLQ